MFFFFWHRHQCLLTLTNTGSEPIETIEATLQTKLDKG